MSDTTTRSEKSMDTKAPQPQEPPSRPAGGPSPPPNGGTLAWLNVLGSFMLYFNTWGILNTFGAYQTYYESGKLFTASSSDISWVGSIAAFMLLFVGLFVGPIYDRGFLRTLLIVGGFMVVFGHMMLSLCKTFWQVLLAQGFVVGIGTGCLFVPCVAIIPQYFSTKMGMAMGVAASGSALGGVIYPVVLYRLINEIGFPWAVRVIGFIALGTLLIPLSVMKLRVKPPKVRAILDPTAFTDVGYMAFILTSLIAYMGLFVILFYLSYYSAAEHITDESLAFYLVTIFNAASVFGRTIPNKMADKMGPFNLLVPASLISGMLMLVMMAVHSKGAIIVMALLSGFMSGALIGLPPMCLAMLTQDKSRLGTRVGMGYAIIALGVLISGPSSGAILKTGGDSLNWHSLWTFGGVPTCAAGLLYAAIRVAKYGPKLAIKA
ncbi:major facilitator superfamily domain-containing protein [Aspergillus caelatus]|uniref:Major facilitator superfamily domain-containing protein n=2 Tax=Aspergillus subgen. Circumdati TaxID=2720871 RepID=A0A5N7AGL4_9EURO|nr:major facilitator superfamily domain-containing protein [Aspergillus caelatus]KAE8368982.1 major facilitator superfamily domain-containing protein [Aspergillus caelatus]KAE8413262.1 major facilitator superfamily domain-containing protein [Aspergillus pseudocaelatus]